MEWLLELLAAVLEPLGTDRARVGLAIIVCLVLGLVVLGYTTLR